jgi:bacteriorhodopsin
MSSFLASSTQTNPSASPIRLTHGASDYLWAVFGVMALADIAMIFWSHKVSCYIYFIVHALSLTYAHDSVRGASACSTSCPSSS